ncbi:MAG: ribosomal protein S18-alanine N-acetyltransferase [Pyrinomonadaceae bacterium]
MSRVERARGRELYYKIAPMSAHDLLEVVEIEETSGLSRWGWDSYNAELERGDSIMFVARRDPPDGEGKYLLGFVAARVGAEEMHVNNIGVRVSLRQRGVGGELLRRALAAAESLGAREAFLEVRAGNVAAQALYGAHGFEIAGRRRNYYQDPAEDALVRRKRLAPRA